MPEIIINPKHQFQTHHAPAREEWQKTVRLPSTQLAACYTLAQMAALGLSDQQLAGARAFTLIMLNLGELEAPLMQERYPAVPLQEEPSKIETPPTQE